MVKIKFLYSVGNQHRLLPVTTLDFTFIFGPLLLLFSMIAEPAYATADGSYILTYALDFYSYYV